MEQAWYDLGTVFEHSTSVVVGYVDVTREPALAAVSSGESFAVLAYAGAAHAHWPLRLASRASATPCSLRAFVTTSPPLSDVPDLTECRDNAW